VGPLVAWAALVGLLAGVLAWNERSNRRELEQRFALRGAIAASFAEAYVDDLVNREREQARDFLSGATVDEAAFKRAVAAFGFEAAVLLDEDGRALRVAPAAPSRAVLSAARRRPVVAFAVPYETPYGRRVFSGAYQIASTPLAGYLGKAVPTASATL
jgi:hypothetical protein